MAVATTGDDVRLRFVLPAGSEGVSGGNIYNREVINALRAWEPVDVLSVAALHSEWSAGVPGRYIIDTLDLNVVPRLAARAAHQQLLLLVHHLPSLEPELARDSPELALETEALRRVDVCVVTSAFAARHLERQGVSGARIIVATPGLPHVARRARSWKPPLAALLVGNLIPRKGVLPLLRELSTSLVDGDALTLTVLGRDDLDPPYAVQCRELLANSPTLRARVSLRGVVADMSEVYDSHHLVLSASGMETFGMALAEARAHGLPVVGLDRGAVATHVLEPLNLAEDLPALVRRVLELARAPAVMAGLFARAQAASGDGGNTWQATAARLHAALRAHPSR